LTALALSRTELTLTRSGATASRAPEWGERDQEPQRVNLQIIIGAGEHQSVFPAHVDRVDQAYVAVDLLTDQVGQGADIGSAATALVEALSSYHADLAAHADRLTPRLSRHLRVLQQAFGG
jgi:hypothetical protein